MKTILKLVFLILLFAVPAIAQPVSGSSVKITDGTDTANVTAAKRLEVDPSGVISPVSLASVPSHPVTNVGTFAVQAAQSGSWTNACTQSGSWTNACTQSGTWNIGTLTGITNVVHVDDNSGTLSVDDGGGSLTVDGSVTCTGSGTFTSDTELPAAATLADNTTNPSITGAASYPHWFDGSTWDRARGDSTDGLLVNLGPNNDITGSVTCNAGTNLNTSTLSTSANQTTELASLSSIDGKITACNTGAVVVSSGSVTADTELTTGDLNSGAGTDTRAVIGLVGSKSGGGEIIPGDAIDGLLVNLGVNNDVTVTGSVTCNSGSNLNTSTLATSANQTTELSSLSSIDGKITACNTGAVVVSSGNITADTELPAAATIAADTVTPTVPGAAAYQFIKTPSANTWDRQYSVVDGTNSTGTGIQASGILAQLDDASTGSVTENQFANVRLSSRRALLVEGVASGTPQPMSAASGAFASGALASGSVASGAIASGAVASGAVASGAVVDGAVVTLGAKADAKSAATDTTAITVMSVLKEISSLLQGAIAITDNSGSLTVDAPVGTPVFATLTPSTTGGWTVNSETALTSTKVQIKSGAATFGGYMVYNGNAQVEYIQVFDLASASVTVGSTTPTYVIPVPATSGANVEFANGINHGTGITVAFTTSATGSGNPGTALVGFFLYK